MYLKKTGITKYGSRGSGFFLIFYLFSFFNSDKKLLVYHTVNSDVNYASGNNWCQISKHQKKLTGEQNSKCTVSEQEDLIEREEAKNKCPNFP